MLSQGWRAPLADHLSIRQRDTEVGACARPCRAGRLQPVPVRLLPLQAPGEPEDGLENVGDGRGLQAQTLCFETAGLEQRTLPARVTHGGAHTRFGNCGALGEQGPPG